MRICAQKSSWIVIRRLSFESRQCKTAYQRVLYLWQHLFSKDRAILFHMFNVEINWQLKTSSFYRLKETPWWKNNSRSNLELQKTLEGYIKMMSKEDFSHGYDQCAKRFKKHIEIRGYPQNSRNIFKRYLRHNCLKADQSDFCLCDPRTKREKKFSPFLWSWAQIENFGNFVVILFTTFWWPTLLCLFFSVIFNS